MQKHRYKVSFFLTTFLYLLLIAGYLFIQSKHFSVEEKTIHLSLSEFVPEVIPPIEQPPEPIEEPIIEEPVAEEEIEPEPEPEEIVEEVLPEPIVVPKPVVKPKPIVQKVKKKPLPKKVKKIVKKKKAKKVINKKATKKRVQRKVVKSSRKKANPAKKSQFLAKVRAKIDRAKSYPRIAQRRGMQGTVKVRFTILANGNVGNISVSGPKVFHNSARNAVKKAFPISTKNVPFSLPETINLSLRYQLK